jgi:hypothetical protein
MRKKHGFTPKYIHVQAPTAAMNRHWHSRCHYKWNSGSAPAGTNNPPLEGLRGDETPGGSHPPAPAAATTTSAPGGQTAAAMTSGRTLLRRAPRPRPHSRGEDKLSKPKSRRPGARMVAAIPSATRTSSAATTSAPTTAAICPPADPHSDPHGRASTDLLAEASYWSKGRTAQEHERRPSSARRLGRSFGARGATTARTAEGGTGSQARAS